MLELAFLGFSVTLVVGLIWLFAHEGIQEQLKEINQLEKRTQNGFIYGNRSDFAKQEWQNSANDKDLPRYRNNRYFAGDVIRGIEKQLKEKTS